MNNLEGRRVMNMDHKLKVLWDVTSLYIRFATPTSFDWRDWYRADFPFFQGDRTVDNAKILPHEPRGEAPTPNLTHLHPVTPEAAEVCF
ncbi:hypothetical protein J6590_049201 [Homalodisca vitripennis]|nr:hypothetical protein J6590_049201 [Homalodisca vitripennis]